MTTAVAYAEDVRDAAAIDSGDWADRPAAARRTDCFQVVYLRSALDAIHLHGQTRTDVEVGGVLIGTGHRDGHGPYLLVEACIPAVDAASRSTNVTFTADAWHSIQTIMDRDYPDKKMVGWYHTHPGFGIFLSGMDLFICDNFFNLPWQVAFVYDPIGGDEGNFVWRDGKPTREPILLEDDVTPAAGAVPLMPLAEAMTGSDPVAAPETITRLESQVVELMERVGRLERRQRPLVGATVFLLAFAACWAVTQLPAGWSPLAQPPATAPMPTVEPPPVRPALPVRGH